VFFVKPLILLALEFLSGKVVRRSDLGSVFADFASFWLQICIDMWAVFLMMSRNHSKTHAARSWMV
jgi:hypothetical protein